MTLQDIKDLPVNKIANDDSVLLMWVVDPLLDKAFEVIKAWGFKYKTVAFTWAKTNKKSDGFFTGLGYWTRGNPEMCLLATKGKPKRLSKKAKNIPTDTRIPKSLSSGKGDTILVRKPTMVANVAKVKAIPTDFNVEEVDPLIVLPEPISSLYLELK